MRVTLMKGISRKEKLTNEIQKAVKILKGNFLFEVPWFWSQIEKVLGKLYYEKNTVGMLNCLHLDV